jgi:poly(3-hydroxybutyrate) depolymerase
VLSDGSCRQYLVHVPPGYDAARPAPLVIALHGYGGDPSSLELGSTDEIWAFLERHSLPG